MTPEVYQANAVLTECNQRAALARIAGIYPEQTEAMSLQQLRQVRSIHACMGITKEGGELLSLIEKWLWYGKTFGPTELRDKVVDELGDVFWYAAEFCDAMGISFTEVMAKNLAKLQARYPDRAWTSEACENRDREAEQKAMSAEEVRKTSLTAPGRTFWDPPCK